MKTTNKFLSCLGVLSVAGALPVSGATFQFYKLSNPQIAADFPGTNGSVIAGDIVSSVGGYLQFADSGLTLKATGTHNGNSAAVVQDHENGWDADTGAGLGVYKRENAEGQDTSDDNITSLEKLTISFDQPVNVTRIDLRAEGHNFTGWNDNATFLLNGVATLLPKGVGYIDVDLTGTEFTFAFNDSIPNPRQASGDQFYLAALTAAPKNVPEGGTSLILLGLSLGGLGCVRRFVRK